MTSQTGLLQGTTIELERTVPEMDGKRVVRISSHRSHKFQLYLAAFPEARWKEVAAAMLDVRGL